MRRRLLACMLTMAMVAGLTACGSSENSALINWAERVSNGDGGVAESAASTTDASETSQSKETADGTTDSAAEVSNGAVVIQTAQDLMDYAERVNSGETTLSAVLANDIDMSSVCSAQAGSFTPIKDLEGTFDGAGHTISNLYCVQPDNYAAPFCGLDGIVKDLHLENVTIEAAEDSAAGIAMELYGTIDNCSVSGSVTGYKYAGGITVDTYQESVVSNCVNEAEVMNIGYLDKNKWKYCGAAAGIAAWPRKGGTITGCTNNGTVTGGGWAAGGIVGYSGEWRILVADCVNNGSVQQLTGSMAYETYTGGIIGYANQDTPVIRCVNRASVSGISRVGGVSGMAASYLLDCVNHGDVTATGELCTAYGIVSSAHYMVNCYNTGNIISDYYAEGTGYASGGIRVNVFNAGTMTAANGDTYLDNDLPWDGSTTVDAMNEIVSDINGSLTGDYNGGTERIQELKEDENFVLGTWTTGSDGLPCLDWE